MLSFAPPPELMLGCYVASGGFFFFLNTNRFILELNKNWKANLTCYK